MRSASFRYRAPSGQLLGASKLDPTLRAGMIRRYSVSVHNLLRTSLALFFQVALGGALRPSARPGTFLMILVADSASTLWLMNYANKDICYKYGTVVGVSR